MPSAPFNMKADPGQGEIIVLVVTVTVEVLVQTKRNTKRPEKSFASASLCSTGSFRSTAAERECMPRREKEIKS